jgi:hypothetical protein
MGDVIVCVLSGSNALASATPECLERGARKQLRWAGSYTCRCRGSKTFQRVVSNNLLGFRTSFIDVVHGAIPSPTPWEQSERWLRTRRCTATHRSQLPAVLLFCGRSSRETRLQHC